MSRTWDGTPGDYLETSGSPTNLNDVIGANQPYSMAVYGNMDNNVGEMTLLSKYSSTGPLLRIDNKKLRFFTVDSGLAGQEAIGATDITDGTYQLYGAAWDGSSVMRVLLDGVQDGTDTMAVQSAAGATNRRIGERPAGSLPFDGLIHYVAIWDAYLTDQEWLDLAAGASPLAIRRSSLQGHWVLKGDSPESDLSGLGNTMGVTGTLTVDNTNLPVWQIGQGDNDIAKSGQQNDADLQTVAKAKGDRNDAFNFSRLPGHGAFIYSLGLNPPDAYFPLQNSLADHLGGDPLTGSVQLAGLSGPLLTYAVQLNSSLSKATSFTGVDDFSVLFWLKLAAAPASAVDVFHAGSTGNFWKVAIDSSLKVRAGIQNVGNLGVSTTALSLDTWHQIGVSRNAGAWVYHIDDAPDASTPGSTAPGAPAGDMSFGMISGGTSVIAAHLATYNVLVSDAQVADHFNYINRVDEFTDAP